MLHLTPEEAVAIVRKKLGKDDVQVTGVDVRPYKEGVAGFMGSHHKIRIRVAEQDHELVLEFFAKTFEAGDSLHSRLIREMRSFDKETQFYELAVPQMKSENGGKLAADLYLARPDLLVLEDLALTGFSTVDSLSKAGLDLGLVTAALEILARFHAASFALERRTGLRIDQLFPLLCHDFCFSPESKYSIRFFGAFKQATTVICDLNPKYGKGCQCHEAIKALIPATCDRIVKLVQPSESHRNVLCHADVWINNFLFRQDTVGHAPEALMIDFQLTRYVPPAFDVASLLCLVLSRNIRHQRTEELLRHYHDSLVDEMKSQGLVPEETLTWQQFRLSYDQYLVAGLIIACMNHQISMIPSTGLTDLAGSLASDQFAKFWVENRDEQLKHFYSTDENYRHWVTEDLEELIEVCILPLIHSGTH